MSLGLFHSELGGFPYEEFRGSPTFAARRWGVMVRMKRLLYQYAVNRKVQNMKSTSSMSKRLSRSAAIKLMVGLLGCLAANNQQAQIIVGLGAGATTVASGSIVAAGSVVAGTTLVSASTLAAAATVYGGAALATGSSFASGTVLESGTALAAGTTIVGTTHVHGHTHVVAGATAVVAAGST